MGLVYSPTFGCFLSFSCRWIYLSHGSVMGLFPSNNFCLTQLVVLGSPAPLQCCFLLSGHEVFRLGLSSACFFLETKRGQEPKEMAWMMYFHLISRWWFQTFFEIFTAKIGEDEPILTNIFQRGWKHQLVLFVFFRANGPLNQLP